MYGYQLMEELERRCFVFPGRLESGSIYTILRRMEHKGFLASEWEKVESGPDRRVYKITEEGVEALRTGLESLVGQQAMMDDLVAFYQERFQQK
jgi:PadR family transcriptional regulator PadR